MKSVKGTKTEHNLLAAFAGESQARNRYTYFASEAKKQGYEQVSSFFLDTAENEKEHAKRFFQFLEGSDLEITASYPAGMIADTLTNLKNAAAGENLEWTTLYPEFARVAKEEGLHDVAVVFNSIMVAEKQHEKRYLGLMANIQKGKVFKKDTAVTWRCRNCGYVHEGAGAPEACPACAHPQAYYELLAENY
ncbi:MAG TPA: rubrerythrin family protein [Syntrophorhabdales bacterium]|nr:rubrerythrin family protein [Syntrophorhabdales bacterium]